MASVRGQCTICMCCFLTNNIAALPCGHTYHFECIKEWLKSARNCPLCRIRCQERQIIRQLFFDQTLDDTILNEKRELGHDELKAKIEELSIHLKQAKDEVQTAKSDLAKERKMKDSMEAMLKSYKTRFQDRIPFLESKCQHLESLLEDQESIKRELQTAKSHLKVTEFYKHLTGATDYENAIDKYVNKKGDPDGAKFLVMLRKQLDDSRRSEKKANEARMLAEKRSLKLEKDKAALQNLVQDLTQECNDLREEAWISTPYNKKLRKVLDKSPPRRDSFGMDSSANCEVNDEILNSAFRQKKTISTMVPIPKKDNTVSWSEEKRKWADVQPTSSVSYEFSEKPPVPCFDLNNSNDDSFFDSIEIPTSILNRVKKGFPKKKTNTVGGALRAADVSLINLEHGLGGPSPLLAPRQLKLGVKRVAEKGRRAVVPPSKSARLSNFFTRSVKENCADLIQLDD